MNEATAPAEASINGPGALLTAARARAGLTAGQAAERLCLDAAAFQALEADRFETFGAAVFVRGHLRHYAELVGVPVSEVDAAYAASLVRMAPMPELRRPVTARAPARTAARVLGVALIGAIAVVVVALMWRALHVPRSARPEAGTPAAARH